MSKKRTRAAAMQSDKIQIECLTKEEVQIMLYLGRSKSDPIHHLSEIQQGCFGTKMATATPPPDGYKTAEFSREAGTRYNSGTSWARNYIRRLARLGLVERPKAVGSRGEYRLSRKGRGWLPKIEAMVASGEESAKAAA